MNTATEFVFACFARSGALCRLCAVLLTLLSVFGSSHVTAQENRWAAVLARTAESVVSLQLSQLRSFDDTEQGVSNATGFVVDAARGIVLTNRHVVSSGPIRISATFQNQERVDAVPLYRDPVHDFAFIRYDPADLKYAKPHSLALRPDKVSTGLNIRVIGSDGGEQLSILTGTIARLDREVPSYGRYGYNDFNTFYLQAAASSSGGSSGSPVIDFDGDVVALNAAANSRTASSFFLPLPRIQHALERLQSDEPIERGGLQTLFQHRPFRDLQRLGLDTATEQAARAAGNATGLLTVAQVIPEGPADGILEVGDIVVNIAGQPIANFIDLEALLDTSIGQSLVIDIYRHGIAQQVRVNVADLHALAPQRFLEIGDTIVQDMSVQHARAMNRPQRGAVVMHAGYVFDRANVAAGSVIVELDGNVITSLDDFLQAARAARKDQKTQIRYIVPGREFVTQVAQIDLDNRWFNRRSCERADDTRFWPCKQLSLASTPVAPAIQPVSLPNFKDALLNRVAPALVKVDFSVPYAADNVYARHFKGVGLIVDRDAGIVAVDRNTVPIGLGDVEITLFGSHVVPGQVVFLHPRHNVALVKFDARHVGEAEFDALELVTDGDTPAESLTMVGLRDDGTFRRHPITDYSPLTINFPAPSLARFQQTATDVYGVSGMPPSLGGPFVDEKGRVHAIYMSFAYEESREIKQREWALPAAIVAEALRLYRSGSPYYSLDVQLGYRSLADARQLGLPDNWLARFNELGANERRVLYVEQLVPNSDAALKLATGDIVLAINNEPVSRLLQAELLAQQADIDITLLRRGEVTEISMQPSALSTLGTERIVSWGGAVFQDPHDDIGYLKGVDFPGVYIAYTDDGSPALWDGLYRNRFVTAVDGEPVADLDDFLRLVSNKAQDDITRLSLVSMSGRKRIVTVQPEYHFWPTFEVTRTVDGWKRINYHANGL